MVWLGMVKCFGKVTDMTPTDRWLMITTCRSSLLLHLFPPWSATESWHISSRWERCLTAPVEQDFAYRLQVDNQSIAFDDAIQSHFSQQLECEVGDVVLQRKDGLFAYQLAVVVDDAYQSINHIVRGADLLNSTPDNLSTASARLYCRNIAISCHYR